MSGNVKSEVTPNKKPVVRMRLDAWTYAEYQQFATAMQKMNLRAAFVLADKIIESWGYPQPFVAGALKKMPVQEAMSVLRAVLDTLNAFAKDIDTDDVVLDLSKWSLDDFLKFNDYRQDDDVTKVVAMVRQVAHVEGLEKDTEPTMTQGVLMVKAVQDTVGLVLSGKN